MKNYDYLYDKEYYGDKLYTQHLVEKKLMYTELKDAYILPYRGKDEKLDGGVINQDKEFIMSTSLHDGNSNASAYDFGVDQVHREDETVIYLGLFVSIWGHCLTDNIKRLWFLKTKEYKEQFANCKLVYVPALGFKFGENFKQLISILGIDCEKFIPITEIKQYTRIILPDECFFSPKGTTRFFTKEYVQLMNEIREYAVMHAKKTGIDKVYFTYANCAKYKVIGEDRLEKYFKSKGYTIIAPEEYSFKQQLNILINCKNFASTIGSCAHNVVFLKDDTDVILIPRAYYLTGYQRALDEVHNLNITYIDSSLSVAVDRKKPWGGPFYYYVSENLRKFFGEDIQYDKKFYKKCLKGFKLYLKLGFFMNCNKNIVAPEFYHNVMIKLVQGYKLSGKIAKIRQKMLKGWAYIYNCVHRKLK